MKFSKYHALGNDYLVIHPKELVANLTQEQIQLICHRNFGIGSDGILLGPLPSEQGQFRLRIFNPDGSEAEKSGNGLRIFSRYLWDSGLVGNGEFSIETMGGLVKSVVLEGGKTVRVEMGQVSFRSGTIPVSGPDREVINESISVGGQSFAFCAATIGNPHCVIPVVDLTPQLAKQYGPLLEVAPIFPKRTNVQFMKIIDRSRIQIEIWERGAGYTLASGSSSSAAAAVAHKLGLCDRSISVQMPGGTIAIEIQDEFAILMTGPVTRVGAGTIADEVFEGRNPALGMTQ